VSSAPDPHAETQPVPHAPIVLSALREHEQERGVGARYEKLEKLGAGGMAVVHRALDRKLGREVALKELREELGVSAEGLARFRREAEAVARLAHPNVVSFFDLVEEGAHVFLVMELVKGEPLSHLLAARRLDTRGVVLLLEKVARGVQHAHENGVLHRDLKPGNILVAPSGEPKVADFGLARLAGERTLTATGEILGTPAYMPPEQARGETVSERADVYSLGAILYEALTGRPPFVADSMAALLQKVLNEEPTSPRLLNAKVHVDLETIALRCLAREPERRYASAGLVADELARFLRGEPIVARPPSFAERALVAFKRQRGRVGVLLALVATAAAVAVGLRFQERQTRHDAVLTEVAAVHSEESRRRAQVVEEELAHVLDESSTDDERSLDRILANVDSASVVIIVSALDHVTNMRAEATRDLYLDAKDPLPEEARAGAKTIEGLEGAVERRLLPGDQSLPGDSEKVSAAIERLEARLARRVGEGPGVDLAVVVKNAQEKRLSPGERRLEKLACRALGRIGQAEDVVPALTHYLEVLTDQVAAAEAGEALARIGGREARGVLRWARGQFGRDGVFWLRLRPYLRHEDDDAPPSSEAALRDRGIEKAHQKDFDGAIADLTSAIAMEPKDGLAWYNRGLVRLESRDAEGALLDLDKAVALRPRDPEFLGSRGMAKRELGDLDGALEDMDASVALDAELPGMLINRGNTRRLAGDTRGAIADLTSAIALAPTDPSAWNSRGLAKQKANDLDGALADYDRALELAPRLVEALANRSGLHSLRGEHALALDDVEKAITIDPRSFALHVNRGVAHLKLGDPEAAVSDFSRAIQLQPGSYLGWRNRGLARKDVGDVKGAIEDMSRAVELAPRAARAPALNDLGALERMMGDHDGAIAHLSSAIALDSRIAPAWVNRGVARSMKGDLRGALADLERAVALQPRSADGVLNRGWVKHRLGDEEGALADLDRAIRIAPREAMAWRDRAEVHAARGERELAISDLDRAIELVPKDADLKRRREELQSEK